MARGHRRHVRASAHTGRAVVAWGIVGLGAAFGLLVGFGVPWPKALLGTIGLLVVLLIAYALELSGLMRPTPEEPRRVSVSRLYPARARPWLDSACPREL